MSQDTWESIALRLGSVIDDLLEEFDEMARESDNEDEAREALNRLDALTWKKRESEG